MFDVDTLKFRLAYGFTATPASHYYLAGVHIQRSAMGGVTLTATDGVALLTLHDTTGTLDGPPVIVRAGKPVLSACKPGKHDPMNKAGERVRRLVCAGDNNATVHLADGTPMAIEEDCIIDGTFPDWRRVMPRFHDAAPPVAETFNARLLARFADVAECLGVPQQAAMRVWCAHAGSPALVQFPDGRQDNWRDDVVGVIMPVTRSPNERAVLPEFVAAGEPTVQDIPEAAE